MKSNRERIINYCETVETHDIEHLENAIENEKFIKEGRYHKLNGCPEDYGAYGFKGLCEIKNVSHNTQKQLDQCWECWSRALI